MKKIVVTLLLGALLCPAAFAQKGEDAMVLPVRKLSAEIMRAAKKAQNKVSFSISMTKKAFSRYPKANKFPPRMKTFAHLSYEQKNIYPVEEGIKRCSVRQETKVTPANGFKIAPALLLPTQTREFGLVAIPVEVFNAMRAAQIREFSLIVSLAHLSNGFVPGTKKMDYFLGNFACPRGSTYLSQEGMCVFSVSAVKEFDRFFEKFCDSLEGKFSLKQKSAVEEI